MPSIWSLIINLKQKQMIDLITLQLTKEEHETTYKGDSLNILDKFLAEFKAANPGVQVLGTQDSLVEEGDGYLYVLKIEY